MGINELKLLQIIGIAQLQQRLYVEYVQNDTLIVEKTAYRQRKVQKFNQVGGGSNIDGLS